MGCNFKRFSSNDLYNSCLCMKRMCPHFRNATFANNHSATSHGLTSSVVSVKKYVNIPSEKYIYVHIYVCVCVYTYLCKMDERWSYASLSKKMDEYRFYAGLS